MTAYEEREGAIEAAILAAGLAGMSQRELADQFLLTGSTVSNHLQHLKARGTVEASCKSGSTVRWGPPGMAAAWAVKPGSARDKALKRERERKRLLKREAGLCDSWAERPPERFIVDAATAPPLAKLGPASAWEWAA